MAAPGINGFHHIAFRAADFDATVKFYTEGLGFASLLTWGEGDSRAVMLDVGNGNCLEVFAGGTPDAKPEGALLHFAFRTDNCDAAIKRAIAAGATVTMEPTEIPLASQPAPAVVRIAFCTGLDGEIIEFFQSDAI